VLYTGGVKSWSIVSAAKDLGIDVAATSTKKSTAEDKARIKTLLGKDGIMLQKGNAQELLQVIAKTKADMLIAGGRNQYTALKARIPFLDINQERHHPYAGYLGMVEMAKELDEALHSPIWDQVRLVAPWEPGGRGSRGPCLPSLPRGPWGRGLRHKGHFPPQVRRCQPPQAKPTPWVLPSPISACEGHHAAVPRIPGLYGLCQSHAGAPLPRSDSPFHNGDDVR
jgi:hypothetical protein